MCGFDLAFFPECKSKSISGCFIHQAGIFGVKCFSIFYFVCENMPICNSGGIRVPLIHFLFQHQRNIIQCLLAVLRRRFCHWCIFFVCSGTFFLSGTTCVVVLTLWPRSYKTIFILNSTGLEISIRHKN